MFVERRAGSKDLLLPLLRAGLDAELTDMEFGDVAFTGKGEGDVPVDVGVEFKTLSDLVSSIRTGRLAGHQLPGMQRTYAPYAWLVVEGLWRADSHGHVTTYKGKARGWATLPGRMTVSELEKTLLTYQLCGGVHVRYTDSRAATVSFLSALYRWFTDRSLDAHTSHLVAYHAPPIRPVSAFRQTATTLPGVGYRLSQAVEAFFGGRLDRAFSAHEEEWAKIDGLGPKTARAIVQHIKGR